MLLTQTEMIYARGVKDLLCNPRYLDGLATTWQTMYMQEPCKGVAAENEHLVMGGGGEQW